MATSDTAAQSAPFEIVLYQPQIPPNTGNILRLCANVGCRLHLVGPLGFSLRNKQLQRARLDYAEISGIVQHADWRACCEFFTGRTLYAVTTRGEVRHDCAAYREADLFVF